MNIYKGACSIALRRELDPMSIFYEERSSASPRKHFRLLGPPMPGLSFFIHGHLLIECEYFAIDFVANRSEQNSEKIDVILQFGARLPQNFIVRNSRIKGKWGPEENSSQLPFQLIPGKTFWMQVLLTEKKFFISINGYHFSTYAYRLPYKWLTAVDVRGDVSDIVIHTFNVKEYPIRVRQSVASALPYISNSENEMGCQGTHTIPFSWLRIDAPSKFLKHTFQSEPELTLPFYGYMTQDKKLTDGRLLRIEGRLRLMPRSFSIALQCGQSIWPQPTMSLLCNSRFLWSSRAKVGKTIITSSAYIGGYWVNREASRMRTDLKPGKAFVIVIGCRKQCYEVFVNSKLQLSFKHQMNPGEIDMVNIRGDIKLWNVVVEGPTVNISN